MQRGIADEGLVFCYEPRDDAFLYQLATFARMTGFQGISLHGRAPLLRLTTHRRPPCAALL